MSDSRAPAPRERGWIGIALALAAFLVLPRAPGLGAFVPLAAFVPVVDTLLLLLPALAICFLLGWQAGGEGSLLLALVWTALAVWLLVLPAPTGVSPAYYDLARAWGLLVAGAFGIVCLLGRERSFIHRALLGVGTALGVALLLVAIGRLDLGQAEHVFGEEFAVRDAISTAALQEGARGVAQLAPNLATMTDQWVTREDQAQRTLSQASLPLYPALLALEALTALALAWSFYHRLSRARIGPALAPLRRFTFNDQLVWAIIAGIIMLIVPPLNRLAPIGRNLVLFFGTLYILRGYGIYAWFISRRAAAASVIVAIALYPLSLVTAPAALGLGLSDIWFDWRRRVVPAPPKPHT